MFEGEAIGAEPPGGVASGEVVFNTVLTGYQEVLTDPSYAGQIIAFTYPHIGNYGVTADRRREAAAPCCRGVVVRRPGPAPQQLAGDGDLDAYLRRHGVPGIAGIDTRALTRHIRERRDARRVRHRRRGARCWRRPPAEPGTDGVDLVAR